MKHYAHNPRKISKKELRQLQTDLRELGDLGGIVHNVLTDEIIGGNQRTEAMPILSGKVKPVITQTYDPPNAQGTVAVGYFEWEGEQYKYRQVQWDVKTAQRANIRANKAGGAWDWDELANAFDAPDLLEWGFDADWQAELKADLGALSSLIASESVISEEDAFNALPDEDRAPFQQMTFTLHDTQAETVREALKVAKALGKFVDSENENSNGNALARICEMFLGEHDNG